jgi:hypothetical protein
MSPEEFAEKMRAIYPPDKPDGTRQYSPGDAHWHADKLLEECLRALGYGKGMDIFSGATKWHE